MENKDKLILKQVSLKAAANVGGTVKEVLAFSYSKCKKNWVSRTTSNRYVWMIPLIKF